jgi:protein TonB
LPKPVASFFTENFTPTNSQDSTAYCAETTYRDSVSGVTRVYYPSGYLKQFVPYADVRERILYGTLTTWYENGVMRTKEDYVAGKRHGELLTYYPDGTLKRRDQYVHGRCGVGTCYGPNGVQVPYFTYEQLPLYPGGDIWLIEELARGVRLSSQELDAMRKERARIMQPGQMSLKREVLVELLVGEDGRVASAKVERSNANFLNNAALRSVENLKRQFVPARRDGEVVVCHYLVPVSYTMVMPYRPPSNPPPAARLYRR